MSKLFDAITKLEAETDQGPIEIPFSGGPPKNVVSKKRQTQNILLGIVIFLILSGLLLIYLIQNGPFVNKAFSPPSLKKEHHIKEKVNPNDVLLKRKAPNLNDKTTELSTSKEKVSSFSKNPVIFKRKQIEELEKKIQALEKQKITSKNNKHKKGVQKAYLKRTKSVEEIHLLQKRTPKILSFREKKLLFQAERLRKKGDDISATRLYEKIWRKTKNPMVANNLAALLMEQERYKEAKEILKKAIKLSPNDEDLKYNLEQLKGF